MMVSHHQLLLSADDNDTQEEGMTHLNENSAA
jgi:hypothetical protein